MNTDKHRWGRTAGLVGLIMSLLTVLPGRGYAGEVVGNLQDSGENPLTPLVTFVPFGPQAIGTNTFLAISVQTRPTNGTFHAHLVGGYYRTDFGAYGKSIQILMPPNDTNTYQFNYLATLANLGTFGWTNWYGLVSERVRPGANVAFTTNNPGAPNESLVIASSGGGPGGGGQPGSANLTNWSLLPTNSFPNTNRQIATTSPLAGGGHLDGDLTLSIGNAAADGSTKGAASFAAADFNASSGNISIDYANGQAASGSVPGFLAAADYTTFNNKQAALGFTAVPNTRAINTTSPLSGGGDLSADRTLSIANAAADGSTKGAASFAAADFNASSGNISIDYANGQAASGSLPGFLSAADWSTFNSKVGTARSIATTSPLSGGGDLSADRTLSIANAAADGSTKGAASFAAADFNASSGNISIDYANGQAASGSLPGFLSAADYTTFNNKQGPGNYLTALTGDGTASGPGSAAFTLATVASAGTYRSVTVNVKGLVTAGTTPTTFSGYGLSDTSANLAAALTDETGSGASVFATNPSLTTPNIGVATATSVNKWTLTAPTTAATLTAGGDSLTYTLPSSSQTMVGRTSTDTLTNKRITARITTIVSSATPTVNSDSCDCVTITALAAAITSMTSNLSGTPTDFDQLEYRIKDDGTARAITWGASFVAGPAALPTTTTISKALHVYFEWDSVQSKWVCISTGSDA